MHVCALSIQHVCAKMIGCICVCVPKHMQTRSISFICVQNRLPGLETQESRGNMRTKQAAFHTTNPSGMFGVPRKNENLPGGILHGNTSACILIPLKAYSVHRSASAFSKVSQKSNTHGIYRGEVLYSLQPSVCTKTEFKTITSRIYMMTWLLQLTHRYVELFWARSLY